MLFFFSASFGEIGTEQISVRVHFSADLSIQKIFGFSVICAKTNKNISYSSNFLVLLKNAPLQKDAVDPMAS